MNTRLTGISSMATRQILADVADAWRHSGGEVAFESVGGVEAAWAVKELIKPKAVIPMHYGANPLAKGTAKEFVDAMGVGPIRAIVPAPGQAQSF